MSVIYTEPRFDKSDRRYDKYIREVYCVCGKKIGTQTKYVDCNNFTFDEREKQNYKFCPYCGKPIEE